MRTGHATTYKDVRTMRPLIVGTLIFSMTALPIPSTFASGDDPAEQVRLKNVELNADGIVTGTLLDEDGKPIAGRTVQIHIAKKMQQKTTDAQGKFTVASEVGGNCAIIVENRAYACRLWKQDTAPPKSLNRFEINDFRAPVVRGQNDDCDDEGWGLNRVSGSQLLGLTLLAGAVTAIVLAVDNDDDGS